MANEIKFLARAKQDFSRLQIGQAFLYCGKLYIVASKQKQLALNLTDSTEEYFSCFCDVELVDLEITIK